VGELPKWVSNDMDIGKEETETAHTKFTEAISVNTAGKHNLPCFLVNMMHSIGELEKSFSENKINKTEKKPGHKKKTRCPKKSGGNAHVSNKAGCDADEDEEGPDDQSWMVLRDVEKLYHNGNLENWSMIQLKQIPNPIWILTMMTRTRMRTRMMTKMVVVVIL
jgi:hypothetical protein